MKTLLHLGTREDSSYQHKLAALGTAAWKSKLSTPDTIAELELACERVPGGVDGIVLTNQDFLKKLLYAQIDFLEPNNKRGVTLDDYQGSLLHTPRLKIPVVVLNPLENLVTVKWALPAAKRFVAKLLTPEIFFPQTRFKWSVPTAEDLPEIYNRWSKEAELISIDIETAVGDPCAESTAWDTARTFLLLIRQKLLCFPSTMSCN